ncbi:hypothetical protein HPB48_012169 [Haemaphysalis longicornis]|uniref:C-CAP/cofactor C-like domain-containing protein n=1 Tax=Haemaphysalis longicornis TaxID=44386 RepID=A0A9J6FBJ7_HAELO|nr:hypothetical protein HPB48_012169 [Haemaphysalis longicornis]
MVTVTETAKATDTAQENAVSASKTKIAGVTHLTRSCELIEPLHSQHATAAATSSQGWTTNPPPSLLSLAQHQAKAKGEAVNAALKNTATNTTMVGFHDCSGEALELEGVRGKDVELDSLVDCEVSICSCLATLFARRLRKCNIRCDPVAASVFVGRQLRVHDTRRCEFLVHIQARSIIEDSTELVFGPYDYVYEGNERDWQASGLNRAGVNWALVDDFNWLSADRPSPNWRTVGQTAVDVKQ